MSNGRWLNPSQPQTLVNACLLLYVTAAFDLLFGGIGLLSGIGILFIGGKVAAAWGIANEHKWGYGLGLAVVVLTLAPIVVYTLANGRLPIALLIGNIFDIVTLALLLHGRSREYQRIWFK